MTESLCHLFPRREREREAGGSCVCIECVSIAAWGVGVVGSPTAEPECVHISPG